MPVLPGDAQPLELAVSAKKKAEAKTKANAKKGKGDGELPGTPKARKRKGDDELLQLDLKRQQLGLRRHAEPWWLFNCIHYRFVSFEFGVWVGE